MTAALKQGASRERPILFSGPMVRAILEGRKTQTRRLIAERDLGPDGALRRAALAPKPEPLPPAVCTECGGPHDVDSGWVCPPLPTKPRGET